LNGVFNRDGHISDNGFFLLAKGEADELARYEMAEHLDFCDFCVDRYSLLLCGDVLLAPPEQLSESVMAAVRRKAIAVLTGQAAKVCAAAGLAIVIWCGGLFDGDIVARGEVFSERVSKGSTSVSQMVSNVSDAIGSWLSGLSIYSRGDQIGTEK